MPKWDKNKTIQSAKEQRRIGSITKEGNIWPLWQHRMRGKIKATIFCKHRAGGRNERHKNGAWKKNFSLIEKRKKFRVWSGWREK